MAKIKVQTDNSSWQAPKKRKPRKPMSDEQRAAASERLARAREKRAEKNPTYGKSSIHVSLHDLPEDYYLHPDKVRKWIKTQKEIVKSERAAVRHNVKGAIAKLASAEGYVRGMERYLRTGDWTDNYWGEYEENKITWHCKAMAYDKNGDPKRTVDTYYPDLGCVYTQEMFEVDAEEKRVLYERNSKQRKTKK